MAENCIDCSNRIHKANALISNNHAKTYLIKKSNSFRWGFPRKGGKAQA
jgi:hypothetical protein